MAAGSAIALRTKDTWLLMHKPKANAQPIHANAGWLSHSILE